MRSTIKIPSSRVREKLKVRRLLDKAKVIIDYEFKDLKSTIRRQRKEIERLLLINEQLQKDLINEREQYRQLRDAGTEDYCEREGLGVSLDIKDVLSREQREHASITRDDL